MAIEQTEHLLDTAAQRRGWGSRRTTCAHGVRAVAFSAPSVGEQSNKNERYARVSVSPYDWVLAYDELLPVQINPSIGKTHYSN